MNALRFFLACLLLHIGSAAGATPVDPILSNTQLWSLRQGDFTALPAGNVFRFTSSARDTARATGKISFLGQPAVECLARFQQNALAELVVNFYARGDSGDLPKEEFDARLRQVVEALNAHTKIPFTARGKDASSAVKAEGLLWQTPAARYLLEYSFTKKSRDTPYRSEFIRLQITSPVRSVSLLETATNVKRPRFTGALHVKRDLASGDVAITRIPMVDQGQKGYCAVACTERVMRYYGVEVDANELAQVANTDAEEGTSGDAMFDALKKLGARLRVRVRPVEQMNARDFFNLMNDYNRAAKRGSRAPALADPGLDIDLGAIYRAMQPELLKEVRNKNKADANRFFRQIQMQVDQGTPLIWSVMLGIVPEPGIPQSGGGHMRLIIGYNTKEQEILYSDSWGAGHELKRMALADAWTITHGMHTIEPLQ